jgi:hypothetical protein
MGLILNHDRPQSIFIVIGDVHVGGFYQFHGSSEKGTVVTVTEVAASAWTNSGITAVVLVSPP